MRELLLEAGREQALVDADILDARLHHLLVALVGDLLVVEPPGIAADVLVRVVADGVALAGLRLQREAGIELVEPAGWPGVKMHVREHAPRAGLVVDLLAGVRHLLVGQEPVLLDVRRRRGDQRDLGVAVEKHLLLVVVELQILDGLLVVGELLVPAGLADGGAHVDEGHDAGVVAQEMRVHVHDELVFQRGCALVGHRRGRGFRAAHLEQRTIDLVHRHEGGGHAGRGLEEFPAVEALLAAELVGHREQALLDLALPLVLRVGIEFVAGDDLGRDRRLVLAQFGRHQRGKFFVGQIAAHGSSPCCAPGWSGLGRRGD